MTEALVQGILDRFLGKYLKNITTEHATVWGGQLIFKNVELRLDVLQEEVGLPVVIQRGFVQELKVYLPLANLLREHIKFTFSNVEVVAQRPETLKVATRSPSTAKAQKGKDSSSQREQDKPVDGAQEGWMRQLLSRIALNLRVEVRNVVFKYCTSEYVSTVSWKRLAVEPTDGQWQRKFADFEGPTRASFKEIEIEDVTWCLDAVDATGGVPRFQPPLFNREKLTVRVIQRKLPDGPTSHPNYPLALPATQVHVRSEKVCMTMSRSQLEMLVRLVEEVDSMVTEIKRNKRSAAAGRRTERAAAEAAEEQHKGGGRRRGSDERSVAVSARSRATSVASSVGGSVLGGADQVSSSRSVGGWMQSLLSFAASAGEGEEQDAAEAGEWSEEEPGSAREEESEQAALERGRGAGLPAKSRVVVESVGCLEVREWAINLTSSAKDGPPLYPAGRTATRAGSEAGDRSMVLMTLRGRDSAALARSQWVKPPSHSPFAVKKTLSDARLVLGEASIDYVDAPCKHPFIAPSHPARCPLVLGPLSLFRDDHDASAQSTAPSAGGGRLQRSGSGRAETKGKQEQLYSESVAAATAISQLFTSPLDPRPPSPPCSAGSISLPVPPMPIASSGTDSSPEVLPFPAREGKMVWPPPNSPQLCLAMTALKHSAHVGELASRPPSNAPSPTPHRSQSSVAASPACRPSPASPRLQSHSHTVTPSSSPLHHQRAQPRSPRLEALAEPAGGWTWSGDGAEAATEDGMWLQVVVQPVQVMMHERLSVVLEEFTKDVGKTPGGKGQGQKKSKQEKIAKYFGKVPPVLLLDVSVSAMQLAWVALHKPRQARGSPTGEESMCEGVKSGVVVGCEGITIWRSRGGLHPGSERLIGERREGHGPLAGLQEEKVAAFLGQVTGMWVGVGELVVRAGEATGFVDNLQLLTPEPCIGSLAATVDKGRGRAWMQFAVEGVEMAMSYEDLKEVVLVMQPGAFGGGRPRAKRSAGGVKQPQQQQQQQQQRERVAGCARGLLMEGLVTLEGREGALRVGGWALHSPLCDLEAGWERPRGAGRERREERDGAAMVLEGSAPWDGADGEGEGAWALGRACGLSRSACKALRMGVRARSTVGPFKYAASASELLQLLALFAPEEAKDRSSQGPALPLSQRSRDEELGAQGAEAPVTPLMEALAQVEDLRRENLALTDRYQSLLALHHVPSPAALRGAMVGDEGASRWVSGKQYSQLDEGGGGSGESDGEGGGDESKSRGAGRFGIKSSGRAAWFAPRNASPIVPGDLPNMLSARALLRRLRLRPTVAGLLSYALLLHFVIAYLLHDLSRRAASAPQA